MKTPKINEYWHVKYGEALPSGPINIIVLVTEDKKEFNPPNWRCNDFKCEHRGNELIVPGNCFVEKLL